MSFSPSLRGTFVAAACVAAACSPLPFSQPANLALQPDARQSSVTFLWPQNGCEPGGYYTLATADGKFLGNVSARAELRTVLPRGDYTFVGWNAVMPGEPTTRSVPVLHAHLLEGHSYYVRLAFGEWDERGPSPVFSTRTGDPGCNAPNHDMSSAMVAIRSSSPDWKKLPTWNTELDTIYPDVKAGQSWLNENRDLILSRVGIAQERFSRLRSNAKRLATIDENDGISAGF